jgi:hypothetical protein
MRKFIIGILFGLIEVRTCSLLIINDMKISIQSINRIKMKKQLSVLLKVLFIFSSTIALPAWGTNNQADEQAANTKINIISSPELESLTSAWINLYKQVNPDQEFAIGCESEKSTEGTIWFYNNSNAYSSTIEFTGKIIVGHEIIVPVMNSRNPMADRILTEGVTAGDLLNLLVANPDAKFIKPDAMDIAMNVYLSGDEFLESNIAAFCETDKSLIIANKVSSAGAILPAVQQDVNAIGFCRLADVLNAQKNDFAEGIAIVPIDKNRNGKIDGFENIYSSPEELTRGAWIGKYPRKLCGEVFAASTSYPMDDASARFLSWVISEGQEPLNALGLSAISTREKTAGNADTDACITWRQFRINTCFARYVDNSGGSSYFYRYSSSGHKNWRKKKVACSG